MGRFFILFILAVASLISCAGGDSAVLHNVNIVDTRTGEVACNKTIFIRNGKIDRILPAEEVSVSDVEDMGGKYVMPGLIDSHVHWGTFCPDSAKSAALAREYLINGVTTVRDMGSEVANIRKYLAHLQNGDFDGPDVYYSAMWGDGGQFSADDRGPWKLNLNVKDLDDPEIEAAVAEARKSGFTGIKIYEGYSKADLDRMISIICRHGMKAWGHASQGVAGALEVAESGIESVSHSYLLIDNFMSVDTMSASQRGYASQVVKKLKENNVILDATAHISYECDMGYDKEIIQMAYGEGVEIAVGTDYFGCAMEDEIRRLSSYGISNKDLLRAATFTGAKILGKESLLGVVCSGAEADLIVLSGNPLEDLEALFDVQRTYSDGRLVYCKYTPETVTQIPGFVYEKGETTINIHLRGQKHQCAESLDVYINSVLTDQKEYMVTIDPETMGGSISFQQYGSGFGFVTVNDMYVVGEFRVGPGESVDLYCDLSLVEEPEMRTDGSIYDCINNLPPDGLHPLAERVKAAEHKLVCIEDGAPVEDLDLTDPLLLVCERSELIFVNRLSEDPELKRLYDGYREDTLEKVHSGKGRLLDTPQVPVEELFEAIISPHKGKVVLVDFWNTWCGPCRSALRRNEQYKDAGHFGDDMVWIYIANETSPLDKYLEAIPDIGGLHYRVDGQSWTQLTTSDFVIDGIPSYVLVQKDGTYELRNDLRDHDLLLRTLNSL
jgi:imidazolonepropionase-like amidohydrolase/thiol-disulfide isomerase/thioredoxin